MIRVARGTDYKEIWGGRPGRNAQAFRVGNKGCTELITWSWGRNLPLQGQTRDPFHLHAFTGEELEKVISKGTKVERSTKGQEARKEVKERGPFSRPVMLQEAISAVAPQQNERRRGKVSAATPGTKVQKRLKITTVTQRKIPGRQKESPSGLI